MCLNSHNSLEKIAIPNGPSFDTKVSNSDRIWGWVTEYWIDPSALCTVPKMNSLYQISSKMLHSTFCNHFGGKRKEMAWLGFEPTTSMLEDESANNHYTMDPS